MLQSELSKSRAREEEFRTHIQEEMRQIKHALGVEKSKTERLKRELAMIRPQKARNLDKFLIDSVLVTNPATKNFILENLPGFENVETVLLYRGGKDGFMNKIFHMKCDNKGPTIVIMKTTKGKLSGGYTSESWETPPGNKWKQDTTAFLFSIDLETTYPINDPQKTIFCCAEFGPYFGNCDLGIHGEPLNGKENGYCRIG